MGESQGGNKRGIDIIVPSGEEKKHKYICAVHAMSQKKRSQESQLRRTAGKVIDLKEFIFTIRAGTYLIKVWHQIAANFRII